jgi:hypothetical protein
MDAIMLAFERIPYLGYNCIHTLKVVEVDIA